MGCRSSHTPQPTSCQHSIQHSSNTHQPRACTHSHQTWPPLRPHGNQLTQPNHTASPRGEQPSCTHTCANTTHSAHTSSHCHFSQLPPKLCWGLDGKVAHNPVASRKLLSSQVKQVQMWATRHSFSAQQPSSGTPRKGTADRRLIQCRLETGSVKRLNGD